MAAPDLATVKAWCHIDDTRYDDRLPLMITGATERAGHQIAGDKAHYLTHEMPASVQLWCCMQVKLGLDSQSAIMDPGGPPTVSNPFLEGLLDPHRLYRMETPP